MIGLEHFEQIRWESFFLWANCTDHVVTCHAIIKCCFFLFFRCFLGVSPIKTFANKHVTQKTWESKGYSFNGLSEKTSIFSRALYSTISRDYFFYDLQGKRDGGDQELRVFWRSGVWKIQMSDSQHPRTHAIWKYQVRCVPCDMCKCANRPIKRKTLIGNVSFLGFSQNPPCCANNALKWREEPWYRTQTYTYITII